MVKQGVQKLKFNQQLKKAESGSSNSKMPKAELTISVNGVTILEPKTKTVLHEYPLHRISYCADDKAEKRFFSFIAKDAESNRHTCFVFLSDKLVRLVFLTVLKLSIFIFSEKKRTYTLKYSCEKRLGRNCGRFAVR